MQDRGCRQEHRSDCPKAERIEVGDVAERIEVDDAAERIEASEATEGKEVSCVAESKGRVYLVGAGCEKSHITAKGLELIKKADVIVYDDLIDPELLYESSRECKWIYVGKRSGSHSKKQEEINQILIDEAKSHECVVRLKGGDSFVFGRGGEEVLALQKYNIPYQVIPGVTAGIAVPENLGIPVTHRGIAQSVTFITGHTATEKNENYEALAKRDGTLVFFMSLKNAEDIAHKLIEYGKPENTPVSILSNGFRDKEKRIDGTLGQMSELVLKARTPALVLVGSVAGFHMESTVRKPLDGVSVIATGTEQFSKKLAKELCKQGARTRRLPLIKICPNYSQIPQDFYLYDYLVFTSANGIKVFLDYIKEKHIDYRKLAKVKFACIGSGTKAMLREYGFEADFVPSEYTAKCLGEELAIMIGESNPYQLNAQRTIMDVVENNASLKDSIVRDDKRKSILILRAENGSKDLNQALDAANIVYQDCHIYTTKENSRIPEHEGEICGDYIVFGSAMGVRSYMKKYELPKRIKVVCIGENTADEIRKYRDDIIVSKFHTVEDIVEKIVKDVN